METTKDPKVESVDMKLEIVVLGVSDVDRAKAFYEKLGWRLDTDFTKGDDFRVIQFTPHNSECSIIFGKGVTSPESGLLKSLTLAVDDIEAARNDLIERGIKVSEVFHFAGGPFQRRDKKRTPQRARLGRSFLLFVRIVRGSGWERLLAPGNQNAASWSRMEIDRRRGNASRASS